MPKNNFDKSSGSSNRRGRSGLDPVDTARIQANVEGIFLRRLFTLNLRTRNVISLITMLVFGVCATGLMSIAIYAISSAQTVGKPDLIYWGGLAIWYFILVFILLIGIALLANFSLNVGIMLGLVKSKSESKHGGDLNRKLPKKKSPKRRKDYK